MIDYAIFHCVRVVRIVRGEQSALSEMDITADGFWRSFRAIALSLPAMIINWVVVSEEVLAAGLFGDRLSVIVRYAGIDLFLWIFPIVALAVVMPLIGLRKQFTCLIIARNWLSLIVTYLVSTVTLTDALMPAPSPILIGLLALGTVVALIWMFLRVTLAALPNDKPVAYGLVTIEMVLVLTLAEVLARVFGLVVAF